MPMQWYTSVSNRFSPVTQPRTQTWVVTHPPSITQNNNISHINAHLFRLHTQLKGNKWQTLNMNFNLTVVINLCDSWACFPVPVYAQQTMLSSNTNLKTVKYLNQKAT